MSLAKRTAAEFLGTFWLVLGGCGSAVISAAFPQVGIGLLGVSFAFGLTVVTMAYAVGHISGGHFNPAVTLVFGLRRDIGWLAALGYITVQILGGLAGTLVAHAMFELPLLQVSATVRSGQGQWLAELVASFGLVFTILAGLRFRSDAIPWLVGLYITAAYWFTASTSFANPAVTVARALSDTFAGIAPVSVPGFILGQAIGAAAGAVFFGWLLGPEPIHPDAAGHDA